MEPKPTSRRELRQATLAGVVVGRGDEFLERLEASDHPQEVKRAVRVAHDRHELSVRRRAPSSVRPLPRRRGEHGRAHRRRPAARRAGGSRSGTDPGGSDSDAPGEAGLNLTAVWRIYERLIRSLVELALARFSSFWHHGIRAVQG